MKKIVSLFALLLCAKVCFAGVDGGATLTAIVQEDQKEWGQVYVSLASMDDQGNAIPAMFDPQALDSYTYRDLLGSVNVTTANPSIPQYFTVYAVAKHGYKFAKWDLSKLSDQVDNGRNPGLVWVLNDEDANIYGNAVSVNPLLMRVNYGGLSMIYIDIYAVFEEMTDEEKQNMDKVAFSISKNGTYSAFVEGLGSEIQIDGNSKYDLYENDYVSLKATPADGYMFYRYYAEDGDGNRFTVGQYALTNQMVQLPKGTVSVGAEFTNCTFAIVSGDGVGTFNDLSDAVQATRRSDGSYYGTILLCKDATLKAGYYTLPAGVTLVIPKDASQIAARGKAVERVFDNDVPEAAYRTLTLENGVYLSVNGAIEVGAVQNLSGQGKDGAGRVGGKTYGMIDMKDGSTIVLGKGANLRAWGYIIGDGEIDVRRGAVVQELFQVMDWPGGSKAVSMVLDEDAKVFLINQYFIQNVEVKTKYRPGSKLLTSFGILAVDKDLQSGMIESDALLAAYVDNLCIIGSYNTIDNSETDKDEAMFLMDYADASEDTWVRKYYDIENDKQIYEINNAAKIDGLSIPILGTLSLSSKKYVLPITSNFKIHLLSGQMDITQDIELLPGSEIEIDKESTVRIVEESKLYLFDFFTWLNKWPVYNGYVITPDFETGVMGGMYPTPYKEWGGQIYGFANQVSYTPHGHKAPDYRVKETSNLEELMELASRWKGASVNVHGTLDVGEGSAVYNSVSYDSFGLYSSILKGWASVYSNNADAGTIIFRSEANELQEGEYLYLYSSNVQTGVTGNISLDKDVVKPLWLKNGYDVSTIGNMEEMLSEVFVKTLGARAGTSFCYMKDRWTSMTVDSDNDCFVYDNYGDYYAKPGAYVAIVVDKQTKEGGSVEFIGNADHTYSDLAGDGRLFILMDDCQWWEVVLEDNAYKGILRDEEGKITPNGRYYEYNNVEQKWQEKTCTITWIDENEATGEVKEIAVYKVKYGAQVQYLDEIPTREPNYDYSYNFKGWAPEITSDTRAISDATYKAVFEQVPVKYNIVFVNEDKSYEYSRQLLARGEYPDIPEVKKAPEADNKKNYYLVWKPDVAAVTGHQTYKATWVEEQPTSYTFTWLYYNGEKMMPAAEAIELETNGDGKVSAKTIKENEPKTDIKRESTNRYEYKLKGWSPAYADVAKNMVYTALFDETVREYKVVFKNGEETLYSNTYEYGKTPACPANKLPLYPANASEEDINGNYYTLIWEPAVVAVSKDAEYQATFKPEPKNFTVSATSKISDGCSFSGLGIYPYNTTVTITAKPASGFDFKGWDDGETSPVRTLTVKDNINLTAKVEKVKDGDLIVGVNQVVTINEEKEVHNLTLRSNGMNQSGQIIIGEEGNLKVSGEAYFDMQLNAKARTWYAVSVPWEVNAENDITDADGNHLQLGKDFDLMYYDGSLRAQKGAVDNCWRFVEDEADKTVHPGRLYMMFFANNINTVRFVAADKSKIIFNEDVTVTGYIGNNTEDNGWNGIANPNLYYSMLKVEDVQHGVALKDGTVGGIAYEAIELANEPFVVGRPVFVQVGLDNGATSTVTATASSSAARKALMKKSPEQEQIKANILICGNGTNENDKLILCTAEDKADEYVIGKDLSKFGIGVALPQIWTNAYNTQLCVNTRTLTDGQADYPLGIYVPATGEYTLSVDSNSSATIYLTLNNQIVWDLTAGAYKTDFAKGTTNGYGIRIVERKDVSTSLQTTLQTDDAAVQKMLIDGVIYIVRDGMVYTIGGQQVKKNK